MAISKARDRLLHRITYAKKRGIPLVLTPSDEFNSLPKWRRLELLAEMALHPTEMPVSAGHRIAAIKEINLMEHVYDERPLLAGPVTTFVFLLSDGTRLTPAQMMARHPSPLVPSSQSEQVALSEGSP